MLNEEWEEYKVHYIMGCDPYEQVPINFYHKIRKFLGLKFREKESESRCLMFKINPDGKREQIK